MLTFQQAGFSFHIDEPKKPEKPTKEQQPWSPKANKKDYPILGDAGFSTPYLVTRQGKAPQLKYMVEHWHYFNIHKFSSRMKEPHFAVSKAVSTKDMRVRGDWSTRDRILRISTNLFQAPFEGYVNHVLCHEMCHQWTSEILMDPKDSHAHGEKWKASMVMIGFTPNQYEFSDNFQFMNKVQLQQEEKRKSILQNAVMLKLKDAVPLSVAGRISKKGLMTPVMIIGVTDEGGLRKFLSIADPHKESYLESTLLYVLPNLGLRRQLTKDPAWFTRAKQIRKLLTERGRKFLD
jgi:hypothetical protein